MMIVEGSRAFDDWEVASSLKQPYYVLKGCHKFVSKIMMLADKESFYRCGIVYSKLS